MGRWAGRGPMARVSSAKIGLDRAVCKSAKRLCIHPGVDSSERGADEQAELPVLDERPCHLGGGNTTEDGEQAREHDEDRPNEGRLADERPTDQEGDRPANEKPEDGAYDR